MSRYNLKYSKEILEGFVKDSLSVAEVIRKLGLKQTGGNNSHINRRISDYGIDTSHFTGKFHNKGKKIPVLKSNEILVFDRLNGRREKAAVLRRALIKAGVEEKCQICGLLPVWNNKPLVLQVDHINGDGTDNRKENLRFLCPCCHSQTENFGAKNIK